MASRSYTPTAWKNGSGGGTPITAAELNRIEAGVSTLYQDLPSFVIQSKDADTDINGNQITTPCRLIVIDTDGNFQGEYYDDGK
ncbi:hypothetical protein [Bifidobacterium panos]|uniref:Uncharacterized protein n=1 Tax=Bifidobacterium panos TaxID=2675321 RepID=A0ABX1SY69_9BIFI|nr:hypothetical protein [Bifidobacterium sp. DSM 109963]NMN02796.1 hypothetical protein [Bifidobacterium sp. DSM 109963]